MSIRSYRQWRRLVRRTQKQGSSRRAKEVLNTQELLLRVGVGRSELEAELKRQGIKYHKDAMGELWAAFPK